MLKRQSSTEWQDKYKQYLQSRQWKDFSNWFKKLKNHKCDGCGLVNQNNSQLETHHTPAAYAKLEEMIGQQNEREYSHLFKLLCPACHDREHGRADGQISWQELQKMIFALEP